jgi:hypothetical protein
MLTRKVAVIVLGLCVLTGLLSPAEAVITIRSAFRGVAATAFSMQGRRATPCMTYLSEA